MVGATNEPYVDDMHGKHVGNDFALQVGRRRLRPRISPYWSYFMIVNVVSSARLLEEVRQTCREQMQQQVQWSKLYEEWMQNPRIYATTCGTRHKLRNDDEKSTYALFFWEYMYSPLRGAY
jgi:hypothetical protein